MGESKNCKTTICSTAFPHRVVKKNHSCWWMALCFVQQSLYLSGWGALVCVCVTVFLFSQPAASNARGCQTQNTTDTILSRVHIDTRIWWHTVCRSPQTCRKTRATGPDTLELRAHQSARASTPWWSTHLTQHIQREVSISPLRERIISIRSLWPTNQHTPTSRLHCHHRQEKCKSKQKTNPTRRKGAGTLFA